MTKEEIMAAIKEGAAKLGHAPTRRDLASLFGVSKADIVRHFATYTQALGACGLERSDCGRPVTTEALFLDWAGIVRAMGKIPSLNEYILRSQYSNRPIVERFGKWVWVPKGMRSFAEKQGLEREWADVLAMVAPYYELRGVNDSDSLGPTAAQTAEPTGGPTVARTASRAPRLMPDRPSYGAPMSLSPLAHEPTNEMGVVYLFGALACQLGFMAMRIQPEFPDCEAMRRMEGDRWQKVRIEFEYESVNFLRHLHDAKQCDLIVCWIHNWKECPLEVLELRAVGHSSFQVGL